jgi:hypothetical protein
MRFFMLKRKRQVHGPRRSPRSPHTHARRWRRWARSTHARRPVRCINKLYNSLDCFIRYSLFARVHPAIESVRRYMLPLFSLFPPLGLAHLLSPVTPRLPILCNDLWHLLHALCNCRQPDWSLPLALVSLELGRGHHHRRFQLDLAAADRLLHQQRLLPPRELWPAPLACPLPRPPGGRRLDRTLTQPLPHRRTLQHGHAARQYTRRCRPHAAAHEVPHDPETRE